MTFEKELRQDYKNTLEAYREAREDNDKDLMRRFSEDLVRLADLIERQH